MSAIEGFVLAGGQSRRMGRNKASLRLGGKTFVERAARSLESISGTRIYIVGECANNNLNLPVVADLSDKKIRGSIIGLYTALSNAKTELAAITFPLVWGWIHFKLEGETGYRIYLFGFPLQAMDVHSVLAWVTFKALNFTALMVIAGCAIAIHRRLKDRGAIAVQQFLLDFVPHLLLIAISVSGLMLTASSVWFGGYMYSFIALTHQAVVIMTLFFLPFGKLFHIVQRPASVGVELYQKRSKDMPEAKCRRCIYQKRSKDMPQAKCRRCNVEFASEMWLGDLKAVVEKVGFDYTMEKGEKLQDYCPRCKRVMRGLAYSGIGDRPDRVFHGSRADG